MKNLSLILIFISAFIISSCSDKRPELSIIQSKKTAEHLNIGGTRLFIIPPRKFTIATDFAGLTRDRDCNIQIAEYKGEKIRSVFSLYNEAAFKNQGKEILEAKKIKVNEYPGKLFVIKGPSENSEILYLLFGDNSFSVLVTANYQTGEKQTREEIYTALKSIYYDRDLNATLSVLSSYSFSGESYKFCERSGQFDVYTADGNLKDSHSQEPIIMVTTLRQLEHVELAKIAELNRMGMEQQGAKSIQISEISTEPINNYETLSRKISFTAEGFHKIIYQAFLKRDDKVILVQGIVFEKDLDKLEEIKQFTQSIQLL
jgi:hypothetical protein